jgi:hypothetical protein
MTTPTHRWSACDRHMTMCDPNTMIAITHHVAHIEWLQFVHSRVINKRLIIVVDVTNTIVIQWATHRQNRATLRQLLADVDECVRAARRVIGAHDQSTQSQCLRDHHTHHTTKICHCAGAYVSD